MHAETRFLAEALAESLQFQVTTSAPQNKHNDDHRPLPTAITMYRTGRLLFSMAGDDNTSSANSTNSGSLIDAFERMISSLPANYVHSQLLHELHFALSTLILSYAKSLTSSAPSTSAISSMLGQSSIVTASNSSWKEVMEGTQSLCGIYLSSVTACRYCSYLESTEKSPSDENKTYELEFVFVSLSWVYDSLLSHKEGMNVSGAEKLGNIILITMARLLVYGLVFRSGNNRDNNLSEEEIDEKLTTIMNVIQRIQSLVGEYSYAMGDMLNMNQNKQQNPNRKKDISFVEALTSTFASKDTPPSQPPQLQYLLAMLRSSPRSNAIPKQASSAIENTPKSQSQTNDQQSLPQQSMTDIQIDHIHSILPTLGEGYIEEALKCYNNDVPRTLEALLQVVEGGETRNNNNGTSIHPRLITLPTNLPRKLRDLPDHYTANVNLHRGNNPSVSKDDGKEHADRQKQYWKNIERQAEEEAFLVENVSRTLGNLKTDDDDDDNDDLLGNKDEYNDDYDDQYDGIGIGGVDEGMYDVDIQNAHMDHGSRRNNDRGGGKNEQDMWRKYNRLVKDVDAESKFWVSDIIC